MATRWRVFYSLPPGISPGTGSYSIDTLMTDIDADWQDAVVYVASILPTVLFPDAPDAPTAQAWFDLAEFGGAFMFLGFYLGLPFSNNARTPAIYPPDSDLPVSDIRDLQYMGESVRVIVAYDSKRAKHPNSRDRVKAGQDPNG
jgi:hypothetical protein